MTPEAGRVQNHPESAGNTRAEGVREESSFADAGRKMSGATILRLRLSKLRFPR